LTRAGAIPRLPAVLRNYAVDFFTGSARQREIQSRKLKTGREDPKCRPISVRVDEALEIGLACTALHERRGGTLKRRRGRRDVRIRAPMRRGHEIDRAVAPRAANPAPFGFSFRRGSTPAFTASTSFLFRPRFVPPEWRRHSRCLRRWAGAKVARRRKDCQMIRDPMSVRRVDFSARSTCPETALRESRDDERLGNPAARV